MDATDAFAERATGTGVYVRRLVEAMVRDPGPDELTLLTIRSNSEAWTSPPHVRVQSLRSLPARTIWTQARLPMHTLLHSYDLVHFVDHKLPRLSRGRSVVTIHDLAFERFPRMFRPGHRARLSWFTRDAVRRADGIIAVSEATKRDLCEILHVPEARIAVIPHGVDRTRFHPGVPPIHREHPFLLAVGALHPRKNYVMLMRAFREVCRLAPFRVDLVILGQRGWMWEDIEVEAARPPFHERIHLQGFVADEDLPGHYTGALALLQPSLYEGFGIPLLEAMASGTPVIAAQASSLPEILGGAGVLADPLDEKAWTGAVLRLLRDSDERRRLAEAGLDRVRAYSWERAARETLTCYRRCAHA